MKNKSVVIRGLKDHAKTFLRIGHECVRLQEEVDQLTENLNKELSKLKKG